MPSPQQIEYWFSFIPQGEIEVESLQELRLAAKAYALKIREHVPPSWDQAMSIRALRHSLLLARDGILASVGGPPPPESAQERAEYNPLTHGPGLCGPAVNHEIYFDGTCPWCEKEVDWNREERQRLMDMVEGG